MVDAKNIVNSPPNQNEWMYKYLNYFVKKDCPYIKDMLYKEHSLSLKHTNPVVVSDTHPVCWKEEVKILGADMEVVQRNQHLKQQWAVSWIAE